MGLDIKYKKIRHLVVYVSMMLNETSWAHGFEEFDTICLELIFQFKLWCMCHQSAGQGEYVSQVWRRKL